MSLQTFGSSCFRSSIFPCLFNGLYLCFFDFSAAAAIALNPEGMMGDVVRKGCEAGGKAVSRDQFMC